MRESRAEAIRGLFRGPGIPVDASDDGLDWFGADSPSNGSGPLTPAAVLVPIVERGDAPTVLFTRRTDHLKSHSGQISFPGGRMEERDATPEATALRETREEVGLSEGDIEVLGRLAVRETGTGYRVVPVVGMLAPPLSLVPDENEVAEIFEVPLDFLIDPANRRFETRVRGNVERQFYAIPYEEYFIWGLTARILVNLGDLLTKR
ncbi:MAG: CoA pyrophosphatase [Defluviicoccus sp.]|nr:CoA pyrophosphatase [Defluviicoccus sp.]